MRGKTTRFFATFLDIRTIIQYIENIFEIQCYNIKIYLSDDMVYSKYESLLDIPNLCFSETGSNIDHRFLIIPKNVELNIREIPQRKGGVKYCADARNNQKSINFEFGGIYINKPNVMVESSISYLSVEKFSQELYDCFSKKIKEEFKLIDGFYVGKEAEEKLKQGWRLVQDERRAIEYDLKFKGTNIKNPDRRTRRP